MIKKNQNIFKLFLTLFVGATIVMACESEADELGSQFFQNGTAQGTEADYDVVIFNKYHNDTIQTNAERIAEGTLGAFDEDNFGRQKSSYVTQVRLSSYDPNFGANPVVDSVVLQLKPLYYTDTDSVKTSTYEDYVYPIGNVDSKKVVTTYPIKKYGKAKLNGSTTQFTVNVHEVNQFLDANQNTVFSDKQVALGGLLGTKTFDGEIRSVKITKKSDNTELLNREAGFRIPLDKNFFQTHIIDKKGSFELKDAASFIRYFKGIRISVAENDGYLFNFNPNEITAVIYYKNDKTENGVTTRASETFSFDLGAANAHFSQVEYNRSAAFTAAMSSINTVTGDPKIYLQGMGGPGAEVKIPASVVAGLKNLYNSQKIGILSAKLRLYTDTSVWNKPYAKPIFSVLSKEIDASSNSVESFLEDLTVFQYLGVYRMVNLVELDQNPAYYDISITQTLRNMIEKESTTDKYITLEVGEFRANPSSSVLLGKNYTTRPYAPNRIVLVGSDPANAQYKARLKVIYSKK